MKIALDYDHTYNVDKSFWDYVIVGAEHVGHKVYIVTARHQEKDNIDDRVMEGVPIIYCNGVAKRWHLHHNHNLDIDVWIDDRPDNIIANSTATKEVLDAWRVSEEYLK